MKPPGRRGNEATIRRHAMAGGASLAIAFDPA